jgi:hypothetical protein
MLNCCEVNIGKILIFNPDAAHRQLFIDGARRGRGSFAGSAHLVRSTQVVSGGHRHVIAGRGQAFPQRPGFDLDCRKSAGCRRAIKLGPAIASPVAAERPACNSPILSFQDPSHRRKWLLNATLIGILTAGCSAVRDPAVRPQPAAARGFDSRYQPIL